MKIRVICVIRVPVMRNVSKHENPFKQRCGLNGFSFLCTLKNNPTTISQPSSHLAVKSRMVTFTFFKFEGFKNRWWAFTQMGLRPFKSGMTEGLTFAKMVGTGSGNGFSIKPDFGQYGWLGVWETEEIARDFFKQNALFQAFTRKSTTHYTVYAQPVVAHGKWDGVEPFKPQGTFDADKPVAVLTRATIKTSHLWNFWRYVPRVSKSIDDYSENRFLSVGIGELPLVQQATFSVWKSGQAMMEYAYKNPFHAEVVKKTRELGWYKEELFARFVVVDTEGEVG